MKLAICVDDFNPRKGYVEFYLAAELSRIGVDVCVFCFGESSNISIDDASMGFRIVRIPYSLVLNGYHFPALGSIRRVLDLVAAFRPDVIHFQPLFSPLALLIMPYSSSIDFEVVGTYISGEYSLTIPARIILSLIRLVKFLVIDKRVRIVFAKNPLLAEASCNLFGADPRTIRVIPLGADPEIFKFSSTARKAMREQLGIPLDSVVIVTSGKITPSKDIDILLRAAAPILRDMENICILIIGSGDRAYEHQLIELSKDERISDRVIFHPWVDREELPELYSTADIAVWPGRSSISIVEAASMGLPLIVKQSPIEVYATAFNNGLEFSPKDTVALRKHIKRLVDDENLRREMGERSRALVVERLNWKRLSTIMAEAYTRITRVSRLG